jgi:serine/threonine protein kinase
MEYVKGVSLRQIASRRALPQFKTLRIIRDLLRIVRDCHGRGYCLGDIHSDNILLAEADESPHIIDMDLDCKYTSKNASNDLGSVCKFLYELTDGPYPVDLRHAIPKRIDALTRKYKSTNAALRAVEELLGQDTTR